jgi:hypothetical protein
VGGVLTPSQFLGPASLAGQTIPGALTVAGLLTTQAGQSNSGAAITSSSGINTTGVAGITAGGSLTSQIGVVDVQFAGQGLRVAEGANAKQGTAVLVAGTVTVANTSITANSRIIVTSNLDGGTPGFLRVTAKVAGTSFTVTSSNAADTSTFAYEIFEPG